MKKITLSKLKNYFNWKIINFFDAVKDLRITGLNLIKTIPVSEIVASKGGTASQPAKYLILNKVFSHVSLSSVDSFIDVGCGQGRVLAFLISQHCPCPISGVELNESIGKVAERWTKNYPNINVFIGDAFSLDYNNYTVLFLSQPFNPRVFYRFVELLENQLKHKITLIYLFDHSSGGYLENRPGWSLQFREEFFRIHGLQVVGAVRRYSIWSYVPQADDLRVLNITGGS